MGFWKWLLESSQKRAAQRYLNCKVVAYYWNGAVSTAHAIKDISYIGAYLRQKSAGTWALCSC